jgi:uncharacterized protein YjbI with pentapeptide repeats
MANLQGANLHNTDLRFANLKGADLQKTSMINYAQLTGATMPDGTVHE